VPRLGLLLKSPPHDRIYDDIQITGFAFADPNVSQGAAEEISQKLFFGEYGTQGTCGASGRGRACDELVEFEGEGCELRAAYYIRPAAASERGLRSHFWSET